MTRATVLTVLLLGAIYCVAGLVLGALAGQATSHQALLAWRWAAWLVSAIAFGAHLLHERRRVHSSAPVAALRASAAAALGAFGLAVAANVHAMTLGSSQRPALLGWSLILWPALVMVPAFVAAFVFAKMVPDQRPT